MKQETLTERWINSNHIELNSNILFRECFLALNVPFKYRIGLIKGIVKLRWELFYYVWFNQKL